MSRKHSNTTNELEELLESPSSSWVVGENGNDDDDSLEEDEDWDNEIEDLEIIRAKWIMDGATTLQEAREKVLAFATYLDEMDKEGYILVDTIDDDYGFVKKTKKE